jgi:hypothetical protein
MIIKKINEKVLKAYVGFNTDTQHKVITYGSYIFGSAVLLSVSASAQTQGGGTGDIFTVFENMIKNLSARILPLSTAAALIGVGTGALMKKFSLGKGDRIETGNKIMMNSIWGWIILNGLTLILNYFANAGITQVSVDVGTAGGGT